jgi:hypothetical protein
MGRNYTRTDKLVPGFVVATARGRFLRHTPTALSAYTDHVSESRFWKTEGGVDRFLFTNPDLHKVAVHAELDTKGRIILITEDDNGNN